MLSLSALESIRVVYIIKIGDKYTNSKGLEYTVVSQENIKRSTAYRVRFNSGYECVARVSNVISGEIKDRLSPTVCGIGYLGAATKLGHLQEYRVWESMLYRCYNEKAPNYAWYGGRGTTVCDRWHSFENFMLDLESIDGYDEELFRSKKLHLDKDAKQQETGLKVYSPDTCTFLSVSENSSLQRANHDSQRKHYIVTRPDGTDVPVFGLKTFCKANDLDSGAMFRILKGIARYHKGWTIRK